MITESQVIEKLQWQQEYSNEKELGILYARGFKVYVEKETQEKN